MNGWRRIDNALLAKYRGQPDRIVALLELDLDAYKGRLRPAREYARLWGFSRHVAAKLVSEYHAARAEWDTPEPGQRPASPSRKNGHISRDSALVSDVLSARGRQKNGQRPATTTETRRDQRPPPQQGGPAGPTLPRLISDPDRDWNPPGELDWQAKRAAAFLRETGTREPGRDLIRVRHVLETALGGRLEAKP